MPSMVDRVELEFKPHTAKLMHLYSALYSRHNNIVGLNCIRFNYIVKKWKDPFGYDLSTLTQTTII